MGAMLKVIGLVLFSSVKFLFAPATVYFSGYNYLETIAITISGGWLGVLVFFYAGSYIFDWFAATFQSKSTKKKKVFKRRNRIIVNVKNRYGILGLALLSPSLISIPIGCLIAAKYFRNDRRTVPVFFAAIVFWSFTLTTLSSTVGGPLF